MPTLGLRSFRLANAFGLLPLRLANAFCLLPLRLANVFCLLARAATVSYVKIAGQHLRNPQNGQYDGDVGGRF